jgi:hypothetical protein
MIIDTLDITQFTVTAHVFPSTHGDFRRCRSIFRTDTERTGCAILIRLASGVLEGFVIYINSLPVVS